MDSPSVTAQAVRLKQVEIIDGHGFERRYVAGTFMAPVDWTSQGIAAWPPTPQKRVPCRPAPTLVFQTISPDKLTGVELIPGETWLAASNRMMAQQLQALQNSTHTVTHCEVKPQVTAEAFLRTLLSKRNNIQIVSAGPIPEAQQLVQQMTANSQGRVHVDTARLYLHGSTEGTPSEGYMETAVITIANPSPMGMVFEVSVPLIVNKYAPMGKLKDMNKLLSAIADNVSVNPEWQARVDQFQAGLQRIQQNINADDARTAQNIARIQQGANDYAYNVIRGQQRSSQNALDKSSRAFALSMNDSQEYHDPSTGQTIIGSNQYNHVYSNGQGEYIYSDSPSFNPGSAFKGNWQEMKPQR